MTRFSQAIFGYRIVLILILLQLFYSETAAQTKVLRDTPPLRERMFFGGNFWLSFGTYTNVEISPVVGLWVLPRVAVAAGPEYQYFKFYDARTSIYGAKGYVQFQVMRDFNNIVPLGIHAGLFAQLEDEYLSLESAYWKSQPYIGKRFGVNTVLAGGGISQQIGRRSSMNIVFLWTLNDSGFDIYDNPEIRVSFNF